MGGVYKVYEIYKKRYSAIENTYNKLLSQKEDLFQRTQAQAIEYDKPIVKGGINANKLETYMMEMEERNLDEKICKARELLEHRGTLLSLKEMELRASNDRFDIVYRMYFLDGIKPSTIAHALAYSESQIYRIIDAIKRGAR